MPVTNNNQLPDKIKEMVLAELRSVRAIQTDYAKVVDNMEKHLELYKKSKGTPEEKQHIQHLKTLTAQKKKLAAELNDKVSDMYKDAELKVDEMSTSDAAGPYNTPFAFGKPGDEDKKNKRVADLTGYSVVKEGKTTVVIDYNTDKDDLRYVSNILQKAGIKAKVLAGIDSEEIEVTIETSDLKKATKALSNNGLELQESVNEALSNTPLKTGKELADYILRKYDFNTDYIDSGAQRRTAEKDNTDRVEWFNSHPIELKKDAFKIIQSKMDSSYKAKVQRVFGKALTDK